MAKKIITIVILYVIMQTCLYPLRGNEWYYVMDALAYFASVYIFVQFTKKWRKSHFESWTQKFYRSGIDHQNKMDDFKIISAKYYL